MSNKLLLAIGLSACAAFGVYAATVNLWTNGQNASSELGQADFSTGTGASGVNRLNVPSFVAVDSATGKVFVADRGNNRVLRFTSANAQLNGAAAEAVIGQPDFVTATCAVTAAKLCQPMGLAVDAGGRLWIADSSNNRVVRLDAAATVASGTAVFSQVLGQATFTTGTAFTTQTGFSSPTGLAIDGTTLYVADRINNRVMRFDNVLAKANGGPADVVLGQATFTASAAGTTSTNLSQPYGLAVDRTGALWVAEVSNNRVMKFANAGSKTSGSAADMVIGQPNFTTNTAGTSSTTLRNPVGVAVDTADRLYIAENANHRVTIFNRASTLAFGAAANYVLGQPNFTTSAFGTSQSTLTNPWGVTADPANANQIYVADAGNSRVMRFVAAGTPTAADVTVSGRVVNSAGYGVRGATVSFVGSDGTGYTAIANSFGYYSLSGVPSGETYMANVSSRGLVFVPRAVTVTDQLTGVDFAAQ